VPGWEAYHVVEAVVAISAVASTDIKLALIRCAAHVIVDDLTRACWCTGFAGSCKGQKEVDLVIAGTTLHSPELLSQQYGESDQCPAIEGQSVLLAGPFLRGDMSQDIGSHPVCSIDDCEICTDLSCDRTWRAS